MARLPRLLVPGHLHLVVQRSAGGVPVFQGDADFELYLGALRELAREHQVAIHAYALLPTQVLLLLTPAHENSLSRLMQAQGRRFGAAYNRAHSRSGVLWEGRFRATVVEAEAYGLQCVQFVEAAPWRAGCCAEAADHPWSSAAHHVGRRSDPLVTEHAMHWRLGNTPFEREALYKESQCQLQPDALQQKIEAAALKGWVLGTPAFIQALADLTPRRLTALSQGRPRRSPLKKTDPN
jgi:putative transposase